MIRGYLIVVDVWVYLHSLLHSQPAVVKFIQGHRN